MNQEMEPPMKKYRTTDINFIIESIDSYIQKIKLSQKCLKAVLDSEFNLPLPLIKVYIGQIINLKDISRAILVLNDKIPLKGLQHLKRVCKKEIILCPSSYLNDSTLIQDYINEHVSELNNVFDNFKQIEVPQLQPKVKKQYKEVNSIWPCNFHPNIYYEKLVENKMFQSEELMQHKLYMDIVFEIIKWYAININIVFSKENIFENINASVIVDPVTNTIVAVAFDNRIHHPMQHTAMLSIDNVAKTQNGGAWFNKSESPEYSGISEVLPYLKEKFPTIKFYQKQEKWLQDNDNKKEGPYLCTGYYIYMLREPCVMCSMALVHSRVKRVFFCMDNEKHGGLKSRVKLQTIASLNHHFEVFTDFL